MSKFYTLLGTIVFSISSLLAQQVPNPGFEDWSGATFDGNIQPASWNASNVTQFGFKFNFAHQEAGHSGKYSMMVQDQEIGAAGITEVGPGYFSLGQPWVYIESLTKVNYATAGTYGGINWKYRPDTMSVWIKRTGSNVANEDFYLLYYAWKGTSTGNKYKGKNGSCTSVTHTDEESDIRQALDANECGTVTKATQVCEGMWRERKTYGSWTNIKVPIYYLNNTVPEKMNIIFSASNYPNFRANSGLYAGNSLYIDDIELIYSSLIDVLYIDKVEWKGFNKYSDEEQIYSLGEGATVIPSIEARRGIGRLTNAAGNSATFPGRVLDSDEMTVTNGTIDGNPTVITVKSGDGKSTKTYKIKFVRAASSNALLAGLQVNGMDVEGFNPNEKEYTVSLPYGTTAVTSIEAIKQEDKQTVQVTLPTSLNGIGTVVVTAANGVNKATYTLRFKVAQLADNTLKDILICVKENASDPEEYTSLTGFIPSQTIYKVPIPTGTTIMPLVKAVSAYPDGEQTITYQAPNKINGGTYQISVTTPGNSIPRVYKLTFKEEKSDYSKLKDLQMAGGWIKNFSADNLIYYVNLPMGTKTLPEITWVQGDKYQTVTMEAGGLDGTTRIIVTAANGDQTVYKIIVSTEKSECSELKMIYLDGVPLKDFASGRLAYTDTLPLGKKTLPVITVDSCDEYETVNIMYGGLNGVTRISASAENGSTTLYQITFIAQQATNTALQMIYIDGAPLDGFNADVLEYWIDLPQGAEKLPEVTWLAGDEFQNITPRKINNDFKITVRAEDGSTRIYTIHFSVKMSSNNALKMIYVNGQPLQGFHPDTLNYIDTLEVGVSTIPVVRWDTAEYKQKVLPILEGTVMTLTVTAENGAKRAYKITFVVQKSENAFLKMIYLDNHPLLGFEPTILNYDTTMSLTVCPKITVQRTDSTQHVTITAPYAAGMAKILVTPESGTPNMYTIDFKSVAPDYVQITGIKVADTLMTSFRKDVFTYQLSYTDALPDVVALGKAGQKISVLWRDTVATIYVDTAGVSASYTLVFSRSLSAEARLAGILSNGVLLSDWAPAKTDYVISLPAGSAVPVLSYIKADDRQVVVVGQVDENKYSILVTAEDGKAQTTYNVEVRIAKYKNAKLINLQLEGLSLAFNPDCYTYSKEIDEGVELPDMIITPAAGQTYVVNNVSDNKQQVIVTAEDGTTNTYTVTYTRKLSNVAFLKTILVGADTLHGFDPTKYDYVDTLPWRTTVVPMVNAIGQLPAQTIETRFSRVNGRTEIVVTSPDGTNMRTYTIAFPVRKSSNTVLEDLYIDDSSVDFEFDPNTTAYTVLLPYQSKSCPAVVYEKAEPEQSVEFISRPLGQTSEVIVTAENGSKRTYSITFKAEEASEKNLLQSLYIEELDKYLSLSNKTVRDFEVTLPYGTKTLTVDYAKTFAEQTVFVEPGGISHPTKLTVKSNRAGEADEVYTITPVVSTQNPAVLNSITVDGTAVPGFDKNRFTYIVNRTVTTTPKVVVTKDSGVECDPEPDTWKWSATVSKNGYTNVYTIYFHYSKEVIPNGEFTSWGTTSSSSTDKPSSWNAPGDYINKYLGTAKAGPAVQKENASVVHLNTTYWAALAGPVPAVINLATMTAKFAVAGATTVTPSGFIGYHNTPDYATVNYKYTTKAGDGALFRFKFFDTDGAEHVFDHKQTSATGNSYADYNVPLATDGINVIGMDIIVDATGQYPKGSNSADLYVDYIRFGYNKTLSALKVNGISATKSGSAFSVTLAGAEDTDIPSLAFTGEVSDQAQKVTWGAESVSGAYAVREAAIVNYAEDGSSANYTLQVKRPLDTRTELKNILIGGADYTAFVASNTDYTYHLSSDVKCLPDVMPVPLSSLQTVTVSFADSTFTINVKAENGDTKKYTVKFVTDLSNDVTLKNITATGITYSPTVFAYNVTAAVLPEIKFEKKMDGQTVRLADGVLTVTAEDGTVGTYTVTCTPPEVHTTAQMNEITLDGKLITGFSAYSYNYNAPKPDVMSFIRMADNDSVVYTQKLTGLTWKVAGTDGYNTYIVTYPTVKSGNTLLKGIYVGGALISGFNPLFYSYTIESDTAVSISVLESEKTQNVVVSKADNVYTVTVTAEDGTVGTPYVVTIVPSLSAYAMLNSIMLDSVEIDMFRADSFDYVVTIPVGKVKKAEPRLPDMQYIAGHSSQKIAVTPATLGEVAYLDVTAEDGTHHEQYTVKVQSEPSHNADLSGIIVNGVPVARFEATRHYYSVVSPDDDVTVAWASEDNFQTVTDKVKGTEHTLTVVAQDGVTTQDYIVDVYIERLSSDATLKNILLNDSDFSDFYHVKNEKLKFSPMNNQYTINLPAGTTILPRVNAELMMEGQSVDIKANDSTILLIVTAKDGVTKNTYELNFVVPLSDNPNLSMIFLGSDSLKGFMPDYYYYPITLPVGDTVIPEISYQKGYNKQVIDTIMYEGEKVTISVTAEDRKTKRDYILIFIFTKSDNKLLNMIYQGSDSLKYFDAKTNSVKLFDPAVNNYHIELPVGTKVYPKLTWDKGDVYQTVWMDTLELASANFVRQIHVLSGSKKENIYTVSFEIRKSDIDTLAMIYVNGDSLQGFSGTKSEYSYTLPAGTNKMPTVYPVPGDPYQTVDTRIQADSLTIKSLGQKLTYIVTAQNGQTRTYTIYFPMELSSDSNLNMILVDGANLSGFEERTYNYKYILTSNDATLPIVTVIKKDEAQNVSITLNDSVENKKINIHVLAEDGVSSSHYMITFVNKQINDSLTNARLDMIYHDANILADFAGDVYEYDVKLPVGTTAMPAVTYDLGITGQNVEVAVTPKQDSDTLGVVVLTVTAPDGVTQNIYTLVFYIDPDYSYLNMIYLDGSPLPQFAKENVNYEVTLPIGTKTIPDVTVAVSFDGQTYSVYGEENAQYDSVVVVTAYSKDASSSTVYRLYFSIARSSVATLDMIYIKGLSLAGFAVDSFNYVYTYELGKTADDFFHLADVTYDLTDPASTVTYFNEDADGTVTITVKSEDGKASATYVIVQKLTFSDDCRLKMILINGEPLYNFDPDVLEYTYIVYANALPASIKGIPNDAAADTSYYIASVNDTSSIMCIAQDKVHKLEYKIWFKLTTINDGLAPTANDVVVKFLGGAQIMAGTTRKNVTFCVSDVLGHIIANIPVPTCEQNSAEFSYTEKDMNGREKLLNVPVDKQAVVQLIPNYTYIYVLYESEKNIITSGRIRALP